MPRISPRRISIRKCRCCALPGQRCVRRLRAAPLCRLGDLAADDQLRKRRRVQRACRNGGDQPAVAQNADAVRDREHFRQAVGDKDDGDASVAQGADMGKQRFGFVRAQRRGRLVEDEEPRILGKLAADLDHLTLGYAQVAQIGARLAREIERRKLLLARGAAFRAGRRWERRLPGGASADFQGRYSARPSAPRRAGTADAPDAIPARLASAGRCSDDLRPPTRMSPASGSSSPPSRRVRVDLPAPFSPTTA